MSGRISANIDAYGTYARVSALADFLEVCAIRQLSISQGRVADLIADNHWQLREIFIGPDDGDEPQTDQLSDRLDSAREASDSVMAVLRERTHEATGIRFNSGRPT